MGKNGLWEFPPEKVFEDTHSQTLGNALLKICSVDQFLGLLYLIDFEIEERGSIKPRLLAAAVYFQQASSNLGPGQTTRFFTRFFPQHLISKLRGN